MSGAWEGAVLLPSGGLGPIRRYKLGGEGNIVSEGVGPMPLPSENLGVVPPK